MDAIEWSCVDVGWLITVLCSILEDRLGKCSLNSNSNLGGNDTCRVFSISLSSGGSVSWFVTPWCEFRLRSSKSTSISFSCELRELDARSTSSGDSESLVLLWSGTVAIVSN